MPLKLSNIRLPVEFPEVEIPKVLAKTLRLPEKAVKTSSPL